MARRSDIPVSSLWIVAGWATVFLVGTDLFVVAPFLPSIGRDMDRAPQSLTVLVSAFSLAYAVSCPISGWIAERVGPKTMLVSGISALATANAFTAMSSGLEGLIASRVLAGIAAASITPMIYLLTANRAEPAQRASRLAIVNSGLIISLMLGAPTGVLLGSMTQWRWVFLGLAVLLGTIAPINAMLWTQPAKAMSRATAGREERLIDAWPVLVAMIIWAASVYASYTLLGTALNERPHTSVLTTSLTLSAFGLGATAGALSGGKLADRVGGLLVAGLCLVAMAVTFSIAAAIFEVGSMALFALGLFLVALSAYGFFPAIQSTAAAIFTARRPTVFGLMSSALYVGITLGSLIGGVVFDRLGMTAVLLTSSILSCLGLGAVGRLRRILKERPTPQACDLSHSIEVGRDHVPSRTPPHSHSIVPGGFEVTS